MITRSRFSFALLAFLIGALISPLSLIFAPWANSVYDGFNPVVTMSGRVTGRGVESVDVQMGGQKHRACEYLKIQAFTRKGGILHDANIVRLDAESQGDTKPLGTFDIGIWRVWPIKGGTDVVVYVNHNCDDRIVVTKIADVKV